MRNIIILIVCALALMSAIPNIPATGPEVGTTASIGTMNGLVINATIQSPSAQETPLQVVCLFEYVEGDINKSPPALPKDSNGMLQIDSALGGLITDIRKSNKFQGKFLETLLITPAPYSIKAKKLLLIGLGSKSDFKPEMMRLVGLTGMREALILGVDSYAHASDLKDAGYSSPTAEVAGYVIQGALDAYATQQYLLLRNASEPLSVKQVTLLAEQADFDASKEGIQKVLK